jgi:hypothetical protein
MALCVIALSACSPEVAEETTLPSAVATDVLAAEEAAEELCPVLWQWIKDVGRLMNELSAFGVDEPDPQVRKEFYASEIELIAVRSGELDEAVAGMDSPELDPIVAQVREGLLRSTGQIDEMIRSLETRPDLEEVRPQARISMLFIAAEKLIDFPKPALARYDDPALIEGFQRVPSCQLSVKDVDDGVPRFNG